MLKQEDNVEAITMTTPFDKLEKMDEKVGSFFPVYLIDDKFGGRGVNFRAATNGLTMIILGSFKDKKTQNQVLNRVGRFGDKARRIRDNTVEEFDDKDNAEYKGRIEKFLTGL